MEKGFENMTLRDEFYILPFSSNKEFTILLLIIMSLTYLFSMTGNMIITLLVCLVDHLHTPMYFFLCNLSIQDIIHVSAIQPKLLAITISGDTRISFLECLTQVFCFAACINSEFLLLTSMAYDRFVAICKPLHYNIIMNRRTCFYLACSCWIHAALNALMYSLFISNLSFCKSHTINHLFCEIKAVLNLSCSDTTHIFRLIFVECFLMGMFPLSLIITSYVFIISTIMKIQTSKGRLKTFSGCSSHLTTVLIFCVSSIGSYMKADSALSNKINEWVSLLYIALVPILNPLVYTLRNKDILKAMKSLTDKCVSLSQIKH